MNAKLVICVLFAVSVACVLPNASVAADGLYFAWGGYAPRTYLPPSIYTLERPPYFALHPPVYYSYPVSRPYGHLPYPYLPPPPSRNIARERPIVVRNPFVTAETVTTVRSGGGRVPLVAALPRRVQVVYPAAVFDKSN